MNTAVAPCIDFVKSIPARRIRSHREFAEEMVTLPATGQYANMPFRVHRQPFSGLLLDAFDDNQWRTIVPTGPNQSGKTLCAHVIPTLHDVIEKRENTVAVLPHIDMINDKWTQDFAPIIDASPELRKYRPDKGAGSKGGKVRESVRLRAPAQTVKYMTPGGSDQSKAGFTSRHLRITEAAALSRQVQTSSEATPYQQFQARLRGFPRSSHRIIIEGTLTLACELPYALRGSDDDDWPASTQSRLLTPCPHCGGWISPERDDLVGWQEAKTELQAMEMGSFYCPECGEQLTEDQRRKANESIRLVHRGQHVNEHGDVVGPVPETTTLWFRWSQWHNLLVPSSDICAEEWIKQQMPEDSPERDDQEQALCQQVWAVPYEIPDDAGFILDRNAIAQRVGFWGQREVCDDTEYLVVAIDPGQSAATNWFMWLCGRKNRCLHIPDYGRISVAESSTKQSAELALIESLRNFRTQIEAGLLMRDGNTRMPDLVGIDIGWETEIVTAWLKESQERSKNKIKYVPLRGRGMQIINGQMSQHYAHPKQRNRRIRVVEEARYYVEKHRQRRTWEVTFDADHWKLWWQRRLVPNLELDENNLAMGPVGALTLYHSANEKEHQTFGVHMTNEKWETQNIEGRGLRRQFVRRGNQHLLDCGAMAGCLLHMAGYRLDDQKKPQPIRSKWARGSH